jgi:glycosyltransferase involved in cell wall biosynthesis
VNRRDQGRRNTILFISHDASGSGAPRVLLNVLKWLASRTDYGLRVLLRAGGPLVPEFRKLAEVHSESAGWSDALLRDVCVVYANTGTNGIFLRDHSIGSIPVITHLHELRQALQWFGPENSAAMLRQSEHFIACSAEVKAMLQQDYMVDPGMISVVPEPIVPAEIRDLAGSKAPSEVRRDLGIGYDEFLVVGCGNTEVRKGTDLFILLAQACISRVKAGKIAFLWVGQVGNDLGNSYYLRDIQRLGLAHSVRLIGQVQNPQPILAACDLFCLPSREDPFPLVMLEAGALGKATIAFSGSGGAEEYCGGGGGFLAPYLDIPAMADRIAGLMSSPGDLARTGAAAKRLVEERFTVEVAGPAIEAIIRRTAADVDCVATGTAQVFVPSKDGYSEANSVSRLVRAGDWNRLQFRFSADHSGGSCVRFDPVDRPAVVDIASIRLTRTGDGTILWAASDPQDLSAVRVAGTAVRVPDAERFRILNLGADAILYLPEVGLGPDDGPYQLEVELRADDNRFEIGRVSDPVLQAYRESAALKSELERSRAGLLRCESANEKIRALLQATARARGRDLYVWGTGAAGKQIAEVLKSHGLSFAAFVDGDPDKNGSTLLGHPIVSPASLQGSRSNCFVLIGSQYHREIGGMLEILGFLQGADYETPAWLL